MTGITVLCGICIVVLVIEFIYFAKGERKNGDY